MKYKLVPLKNKRPKNKWVISAEFVHGDADSYTTEVTYYKEEEEFLKAVSSLNFGMDIENNSNYSYREREKAYEDWAAEFSEEEYGFFIPWDATSNYNYRAKFENRTYYHYDKDGNKFMVIFDKKSKLP